VWSPEPAPPSGTVVDVVVVGSGGAVVVVVGGGAVVGVTGTGNGVTQPLGPS
jgi:hypothetical protein